MKVVDEEEEKPQDVQARHLIYKVEVRVGATTRSQQDKVYISLSDRQQIRDTASIYFFSPPFLTHRLDQTRRDTLTARA